MRDVLWISIALLMACEAADDGPTSPSQLGDAGARVDAGRTASDAGDDPVRPPPPATGGAYVVVADFTDGLGFSDWTGADVDAVEWRCGDEVGYAVAARGERDEAQAAYSVDPALGPPDGPCDPRETCATPLGRYGYLAFQVEAQSLAGCDVTVYELADRSDEMFNVYDCPSARFDNTCRGPIFSGTDGAAASGTF